MVFQSDLGIRSFKYIIESMLTVKSLLCGSGCINFVILAVTTFLLNGTHNLRQVSQGLSNNPSGYLVSGVLKFHHEFSLENLCYVCLDHGNRN